MSRLAPYFLLAALGAGACSPNYEAMIVHDSGRGHYPHGPAYEIALHAPGKSHANGDFADIGILVIGDEQEIRRLEKDVKPGIAIVVSRNVTNSTPVRFDVGGSIVHIARVNQINFPEATQRR